MQDTFARSLAVKGFGERRELEEIGVQSCVLSWERLEYV